MLIKQRICLELTSLLQNVTKRAFCITVNIKDLQNRL